MSELVDLFVPLEDDDPRLARRAELALGWPAGTAVAVRVVRRSLDARKGRPLGFRVRCEVAREPFVAPAIAPPVVRAWPSGRAQPRVVVIGSGPAGTWAALRLAEAGLPSTILERGKEVQPRRRDLAELTRGRLNPDSNYCFGEGGAGTYSDGKLYTRAKDRAAIAAVLADLVRFGAPEEVAIETRAHVGSNRLPRVLVALRMHLASLGVTYHFGTQAAGLRMDAGRVRAVRLEGGDEVPADAVVLAVGHSARDVYAWAHRDGVPLERKAIAVGVRVEHPQSRIDELQYGSAAGHPRLPPAFYELSGCGDDRGVYSFCMCPGGWIVPAATEPEGVVVNGMSLSRRDSPFANSGFVVPVEGADFGPDALGPFAGVAFQRQIEGAAFAAGGGGFRAPAQRLVDFLADRPSSALGPCSYRPGVASGRLEQVFPSFVIAAMREGLRAIIGRVPGFSDERALMIAAETRTSAPVRILRDPQSLQSPGVAGLYPAGEGAGFAGGIVSAALDGARIAERILATAG